MNRTMKSSITLVIALMISLVTFTQAQSEQKRGRAARVAAAKAQRQAERESGTTERTDDTQRRTNSAEVSSDDSDAQNERFGWQHDKKPEPLVGAWYINIPQSNGGLPPFNALHTFNDGGTFTESSDLLVTQTEGPAFGVWKGKGARYNLTFQLFVFDPEKKESVGMVRVRATIRMISHDEFVADSVVDFIAPDGTIEKGIDGGPFYGKRIKVLPAN